MKRLPYEEGDIFCLPLIGGGFVRGVVARMPKGGKILLGYFFSKVFEERPSGDNAPPLRAADAAKVIIFGDLGLCNGSWPIIGRVPDWHRDDWPMPKFVRRDPLSEKAELITYSEEEPFKPIRTERCDPSIVGYERDSLYGAGAVETALTMIAKPSELPSPGPWKFMGLTSPLPADFTIAPDVYRVQFSKPLAPHEYQIVATELRKRPDVLLRVYSHSEISDLDFLRHFSFVRRLALDLWSLENFDGLKHVDDLHELMLGQTKRKGASLRVLGAYPRLRRLYLEGQQKDIDILSRLIDIERLTLRSISLENLELLRALPKLRHLEIKLGGTRNLRALSFLQTIQYLELWMIRGLDDISAIAAMEGLEGLFLQALRNVSELPSLSRLQHLEWVYLEKMDGLRDLSPIAEAPHLEDLYIINMRKLPVEALNAFKGHPTLKGLAPSFGSNEKNIAGSDLLKLPKPTRSAHPDHRVLGL